MEEKPNTLSTLQEEEPHIKKTMKNKKEKVEYILRVNTVSFKVKKKKIKATGMNEICM
jgi:hypothetical protein